jgi:hypothetical protein
MLDPSVIPTSDSHIEGGDWERLLLVRFYWQLDRAGLPIPRGEDLIKLVPMNFGTDALWPDSILEPLLAFVPPQPKRDSPGLL